jgi:hypothetical protein
MCTVTIIPLPSSIRLACNRDESRLRPAALPPELRRVGKRLAVMPIDPAGGGTWIAANDAGIVCTLLNVYEHAQDQRSTQPGGLSRGLIIPQILGASTLAATLERVQDLDLACYAPFRLVIADRKKVAEFVSSGTELRGSETPLAGPAFFTSSVLGDQVVGPPRWALFQELLGRGQATRIRQDDFHRHSWPEQTHLSVCMTRPDARTVSFTTVEIGPEHVTMHYHADAPDQPAPELSP